MSSPISSTAPPSGDSTKSHGSPRERYRAQTISEIKHAAVEQMAAGGAGAVSINALGRRLGMAGPSIYRYFPSRDALLVELVVDAYEEIAGIVVSPPPSGDDPRESLRSLLTSYRDWAVSNPERYDLVFGSPVPGFVPTVENTGEAAVRALLPMLKAVDRLRRASSGERRADSTVDRPIRATPSARWAGLLAAHDISTEGFVAAIGIWTRIHGAVALELHGHSGYLVTDTDDIYASAVEQALADAVDR